MGAQDTGSLGTFIPVRSSEIAPNKNALHGNPQQMTRVQMPILALLNGTKIIIPKTITAEAMWRDNEMPFA
jgi:hypothetical protein